MIMIMIMIIILLISKIPSKWAFARYRSCPYGRERASQSLVASQLASLTPRPSTPRPPNPLESNKQLCVPHASRSGTEVGREGQQLTQNKVSRKRWERSQSVLVPPVGTNWWLCMDQERHGGELTLLLIDHKETLLGPFPDVSMNYLILRSQKLRGEVGLSRCFSIHEVAENP